ncbi:MAG: alpha/beta hydrolase [Ferruginibacter sp.]|nr:alpha/beta hydrolase [Ferruginibacter sp.]
MAEISYVNIDDFTVAYRVENPAQEKTIFFIHGNSCSSRSWNNQIKNEALSGYRLIALDLPDHGNSQAIDPTKFSVEVMAAIVGSAIRKLCQDKPFIICAISLGTNIVAELLDESIKPKGLLFAGPCIMGEGFEMTKLANQSADLKALFTDEVPEDKVIAYFDIASFSQNEEDKKIFVEDFFSVKNNFRPLLFGVLTAGLLQDEIKLVTQKGCPVCIVYGEDDKIINTGYLKDAPINLWNKTIYTIPSAGHFVNIDAPAAFNKLLAGFALDMF